MRRLKIITGIMAGRFPIGERIPLHFDIGPWPPESSLSRFANPKTSFFHFPKLQSGFPNLLPMLVNKFRDTSILLRGESISLTPSPQLGGLGYHFLSGSSLLTCSSSEDVPVAMLPPRQHSSQDHLTTQAFPLRQRRDAFG